jgi:hypothetical protein
MLQFEILLYPLPWLVDGNASKKHARKNDVLVDVVGHKLLLGMRRDSFPGRTPGCSGR